MSSSSNVERIGTPFLQLTWKGWARQGARKVLVDIRDGDRPRPTFISANLDPKYKQELKSLLKEYKDCFA